MGLFDRDKMSSESGEWAAIAMGCMVFADGSAGDAEIAAAKTQIEANPVIKDSIGTNKALEIFGETVEAIRQIPSTMLATYEIKLSGLVGDVESVNERNFALSTVIAVAMGDGTLTAGEYAMVVRFRDMLSATIPIPQPGQSDPARALPESQRSPASSAACPTCGNNSQYYPSYGYWCVACQAYAHSGPAKEVAVSSPASSEPAAVANPFCGYCGKSTQFFQGYGHWCAPCEKYTSGS